jgi:hypothetical protein
LRRECPSARESTGKAALHGWDGFQVLARQKMITSYVDLGMLVELTELMELLQEQVMFK